jgi:hypothetical protein
MAGILHRNIRTLTMSRSAALHNKITGAVWACDFSVAVFMAATHSDLNFMDFVKLNPTLERRCEIKSWGNEEKQQFFKGGVLCVKN